MNKMIFALLILVLLTGCNNILIEGNVYDKEHRESYTQLVYMPMTVLIGKFPTTYLVPFYVYHPENWIVYIKEFDTKKNDFRYNYFFVYEEVYNSINVGDRFRFSENSGWKEEPVTKIRK